MDRDVRAEPRSRRRTRRHTDPLLWRLTEVRFEGRRHRARRPRGRGRGRAGAARPGRAAGPGRAGGLAASRRAVGRRPTRPSWATASRGGSRPRSGATPSPRPRTWWCSWATPPTSCGRSPGSTTVRSIEAAPISRNLTRAMRIVFAIGGVGLLAPVVVFVATATRLAAARREQRLAALRLAGATTGQVGVMAAVEAVARRRRGRGGGARRVPGAAVAAGAGPARRRELLPVRPAAVGGWRAGGRRRRSSRWRSSAGVVSLRRIRISPLGVARRAPRARPTPRPLLLVVAGLAALVVAVVVDRRSTGGRDGHRAGHRARRSC